MNSPSVIYLAINLPRSSARRAMLAEQARVAGIDIQIVPAVSGAELTPAQKAMYNSRKRAGMYPADLTPNEQACMHSHLKALRTFLESGADYGAVFEDDVLLSEDFREGIDCLLTKVQGWQAVKLYTDNSRLYPICPTVPGTSLQPVFPKKVLWGAVGYLYSRTGAEQILRHLSSFWLGADAMLGKVMLEHRIPVIGVSPNLVGTAYPANEQSDIDDGGHRLQLEKRRSLPVYLRYRASVIRTAMQKNGMRALLRRCIRIVPS